MTATLKADADARREVITEFPSWQDNRAEGLTGGEGETVSGVTMRFYPRTPGADIPATLGLRGIERGHGMILYWQVWTMIVWGGFY